MTKKELSRLYYLNREIERYKRELSELESAATTGVAKITGLPHVTGISDKTGNYAVEIAERKELIALKAQQCIIEYNRLNRYISTVDDSRMRLILSLRYINCMDWKQVAASIGGGNTDKGVQTAVKRFLDKQ